MWIERLMAGISHQHVLSYNPYIIFQDLWTFPRTFFNYKEYQQSTPFLIPNRKSIRVCLRTIRKND